MGSVNLLLVDMHEWDFISSPKVRFLLPRKRSNDYGCCENAQKIEHLSNINLVKNADGLIASENIDFEVEWIGEAGKRLP